MKSIRRNAYHGPTCRSICIFIICIILTLTFMRPKQSFTFEGEEDDDGDLRIVKERNVHKRAENERFKHEVDEKLRSELQNKFGEENIRDMNADKIQEVIRSVAEEEEKEQLEKHAHKAHIMTKNGEEIAKKKCIHVILTSNGSPYMNWQTKVMYYSYLKVAKLPGSDMKHFTRILHRMNPDELMDEIPTFRVNPLDPTCDTWCAYPVASRPDAINQWLNSDDVKCDWVLMVETDYIFIKPFNIPSSGNALGFKFGYINPTYMSIAHIMKRYYPDGRLEDIPSTGNAPLLAPVSQLRKVISIWVKITDLIEKDEEAKKLLGWVREMYAFSIATALAKMPIDLPTSFSSIMSQPPVDSIIGDAYIIHYTWESVIKDDNGKTIWEFDKRKYTSIGLPDLIPDPPADYASEVQKLLIKHINAAINNLPKYTLQELIQSGKSKEEANEILKEWMTKHGQGKMGGREKNEILIGNESIHQDKIENRKSIHVIVTSNGSPYMNWQTRILYYTYLKVSKLPNNDMKYFTRILHRMKDDELSTSIPTLRVDPIDPKCDEWCDYPVASRPDAIQQWLNSGDVKGDWVFMIETDHVFVKGVSIPSSNRTLGFPFGYIIPTYPTIQKIMKKYYPGNLEDIPGTGNAPLLTTVEDLRRVVPIWVNLTAQFEIDNEAKKKLDWIREMYAFSIASALAKLPIDLPPVPHSIMVQPPADSVLGDAAIIHYTWGFDFKNSTGGVIWSWDKRDYSGDEIPAHIPPPPRGMANELQVLFIEKMNEAIDTLFN